MRRTAPHNVRGRADAHGFTLIEVIIAMFVIALGIGALLATLSAAAENTGHLRDKSLAEWIALNRLSEVRLATSKLGVGTSSGSVEFAGSKWRWRQQVADPGIAGILRIDVAVARSTDASSSTPAAASDASKDEDFSALATAYGFAGTAVGPPSGLDPDWSLDSLQHNNPPKP